ncbi:MAG: TetR/AcrR family transcriptional regulator [Thermoanaerobaculaceae bacterium]|nr:TetR/AcrR family transcriptional regulator [Thermoanaerobaculaceae bacterium]MDI9621591.1 helix-turn-helix domain-containing protein [Acidobacteriota bacterium]
MRRSASNGTPAAERLLVSARRLFAQRGFFGVSIDEVVRAAAVTPPSLYYHFKNKEGLHAAVCRRAAADYQAALSRAASASGSVVQRIVRVCEAHVLAADESILLAAAFKADPASCGVISTWPARDAWLSGVVAVLRVLIVEGIEAAEIGECDAGCAAIALAGAATAASWLGDRTTEPFARDGLAAALATVFQGLHPAGVR